MKRLTKTAEINVDKIDVGDYVDFGSYYGKLYICADYRTRFWVIDKEEDRRNPNARGWYISKNFAKNIIDKDVKHQASSKIIKSEEKLTIEKVKEIAMKNYNSGGDVVIECWDDKDIQEFIDGTGEYYEKPGTLESLKNIFEINKEIYDDADPKGYYY